MTGMAAIIPIACMENHKRPKRATPIWVIADEDLKRALRDMHRWGMTDMVGKHNSKTRVALIEKRLRKKYG
jgi:hypothetical protein